MIPPKTRGACLKCGKALTNVGMARHLSSCLGPGPALHVAVDVGPGTWWMHLALAPTATLEDLDEFLRATWLECCGHMSAFEVGDTTYRSRVPGGDEDLGQRRRSMSTLANGALQRGIEFWHDYDFGTTTILRGRVFGGVPVGSDAVSLLARNESIPWPCDVCGRPGTRICSTCYNMVCATCRMPCKCRAHSGLEPLPVVNSPRMGVCGYAGPQVWRFDS